MFPFPSIWLILLILLLIVVALTFYNFHWKRRNLPPGPTPWPLIGNLLAIKGSGSGEKQFKRWAKEYGPIYTYWIGELPVVCVADYGQMVELFRKDGDNFADRYNLPFERTLSNGKILAHGILISSGARWREQRKFALQVLKDLGLGGKNSMQNRILADISAMFAKIDAILEANCGEAEINLADLIEVAIGSIINNIIFGYRFEGDREAEFWQMKHMLDEHVKEYGGHSLFWMYMLWPNLLRNVPWFKQKRESLEARIQRFHAHLEGRIRERESQIDFTDLKSPPSDFVEAFLKEKARREASNDAEGHFTMFQLGMMCFDLYVTGQETTATVLCWAIALLLNNPECMAKMEAEMARNGGGDGDGCGAILEDGPISMVTMEKRAKLPYTNAAINEVLRMANIAPHNFLRKAGRDVQLGDGTNAMIKKGTCICPQISVLLCDEKIFPEPDQFNPGRFLDEEGRLKRCDQLVPFSIGKRQCLGEALARLELFLFIANILNRYEISPGNRGMPSLERIPGAVVHCAAFTCRIRRRRRP